MTQRIWNLLPKRIRTTIRSRPTLWNTAPTNISPEALANAAAIRGNRAPAIWSMA